MDFTFEFLPYYAGGIVRNADFSFYEIHWNTYGKYGHFEFQNNIPSNIHYKRELKLDHVTRHFICDFTLRTDNDKWPYRYQQLYSEYGGKVLTSLPNGIILFPEPFLCARLRLQFSIELRRAIANQLNFRFRNEIEYKILLDNQFDISEILKEMPIEIV